MDFKEFVDNLRNHCLWVLDQMGKGLSYVSFTLAADGTGFVWITTVSDRIGNKQESSLHLEDGDILADMMAIRAVMKKRDNTIMQFVQLAEQAFPEMDLKRHVIRHLLIKTGVSEDKADNIMELTKNGTPQDIEQAMNEIDADLRNKKQMDTTYQMEAAQQMIDAAMKKDESA